MKRKLLSILALLCLTGGSAWADKYLYLDYVSGTSATLMYDDFNPSYVENGETPYYDNNGSDEWYWYYMMENDIKNQYTDLYDGITTINVDASCLSFEGTVLEQLFTPWGDKLTTINNLGNLNTSRVTNMSYMFNCCSALTTLDLSGWNTSSVTNMEYMFYYCSSLTTIYVGDGWSIARNNTGMFTGCGTSVTTRKIYTVTAHEAKSGEYWATFYSTEGNYQAPEGTQVFAVNLTGTALTLNEISDRIVKSGEGVVLKNTTTGSITMTLTATTPAGDFSANSLTGTMTEINTTGANDYYVLNYVSGDGMGLGFYKLSNTSGTIGANKAYLTYSGSLVREFFAFEDDATSINEELGMKNEELYEEAIYNLAGQRIQKMQKGINIVNGKKVLK